MERRSILAALLAFLSVAGSAAAQTPSPPPPPVPGAAAVLQYRETLPTGSGPAAPGATRPSVAPLPQPVAARIAAEGRADAPLLEAIATSSDYGAPPTGVRVTGEPAADRVSASVAPVREPSLRDAFSALADALSSGANGRLALLAAMLLAITVAVAATAPSRARIPPGRGPDRGRG